MARPHPPLRDSQRQRVYNAENTQPRGRAMPTVPEMQRYVDRITSTQWWQRRYPRAATAIQVRPGHGRRHACAYSSGEAIAMPRSLRSEMVVLHELAHSANMRQAPGAYADHGWEFVVIYLDLVHHFMGRAAADGLRAAFKAHRVRLRPKRAGSGPGNPGALAAWRERQAAAAGAKQ
jgi:putative metallohydrolase (TIGR04338 family)